MQHNPVWVEWRHFGWSGHSTANWAPDCLSNGYLLFSLKFGVLLVGRSLSSPSAHPSGPVNNIFAGKKLTRNGCPWGNNRNMTWTEKTTSNGTFQCPKFSLHWSNINSNTVGRIKSPTQICLTTRSIIPRLCAKKLPCPVLECSSQKTLDLWGKPPQPTPKSQCCFHFQLKEDCDDNSRWNPIGIHIQEHNKFTIEEQAATVTIAWCIHPPESDHLSPNHLWDETCIKGAGRAGGRHGKKHRLRQKCRRFCASRETLHDCFTWPQTPDAKKPWRHAPSRPQ